MGREDFSKFHCKRVFSLLVTSLGTREWVNLYSLTSICVFGWHAWWWTSPDFALWHEGLNNVSACSGSYDFFVRMEVHVVEKWGARNSSSCDDYKTVVDIGWHHFLVLSGEKIDLIVSRESRVSLVGGNMRQCQIVVLTEHIRRSSGDASRFWWRWYEITEIMIFKSAGRDWLISWLPRLRHILLV